MQGYIEVESLGGLEVDHQLECCRLHDRQVGRPGAVENFRSVRADLTIRGRKAGPVADQGAGQREFAPCRHEGKRMPSRERDKLIAATGEEHIAVDEQRSGHADRTARLCTVAASCSALALLGLISSAMVFAAGTSSCRSPSCFACSGPGTILTPVRLPPGRLRLVTRPAWIGSMPLLKTMGIVVVTAFAASADGPSPAKTTATFRRTKSAASAGSRSYWPSAQRYSIATFWPSI